MFADFVYEHARKSYAVGQKGAAFSSVFWAMQIEPLHTLALVTAQFHSKLHKYTFNRFKYFKQIN